MTNKPHILLVWYYDRKDLFAPFEQLKDSFTYTLLFYKFKEDESHALPYPTYYWAEFNSPNKLIEVIRPDMVVFMGLESNYAIGLNITCKNAKIPTINVEHGVRFDLNYYMQNEERIGNRQIKAKHKQRTLHKRKWHSLLFLINSLKIRNAGSIITLAKYVVYSQKHGIATAMKKVKFKLRLPDYYINFTKYNARYILKRDGVSEKDIIEIGNPAWDSFFKIKVPDLDNYFLHIDTPLLDAKNGQFDVTLTERNNFFLKLNLYCLNQNCRLLIKLHPDSYESTNLPQHENISYLREVELTGYIGRARGCFGFFSSLIIPIAHQIPCVLFQLNETPLQKDLEELGVIKAIDFKTFVETDIEFPDLKGNRSDDEFVKRYIFRADGKSTDRLRSALLNVYNA